MRFYHTVLYLVGNMKIFPYLSISAANALSVSTEGSNEVRGRQKTILVGVHDTEGLFKLLDSGVGERFEDVSFLRHFGFVLVLLGGLYLK